MIKLKNIYNEIKLLSSIPKLVPGRKYKWVNNYTGNTNYDILVYERPTNDGKGELFIDQHGDGFILNPYKYNTKLKALFEIRLVNPNNVSTEETRSLWKQIGKLFVPDINNIDVNILDSKIYKEFVNILQKHSIGGSGKGVYDLENYPQQMKNNFYKDLLNFKKKHNIK